MSERLVRVSAGLVVAWCVVIAPIVLTIVGIRTFGVVPFLIGAGVLVASFAALGWAVRRTVVE